ncbi:DUF1294 domain-containing protein [Sphingomonas sp. G-3-2-10]|nr:DUF1294 domain-containing protein [Sphingomonas sp. G-3-2-10]
MLTNGPVLAVAALVAINFWTILRFRQDKRAARIGTRRVPERQLLGLALIGGSPGALLARHLYRHKTRKQPFSTLLWLIVAFQAAAILMLALR